MTHGIIFTGWKPSSHITPQAGPYRIRTYLEENGYDIEVIDHVNYWSWPEMLEIISAFHSEKLLFIGFSTVFYREIKPMILFRIKKKFPNVKLILGAQEVFLSSIIGVRNVDKAFFGYSEASVVHYLDFLTGKRKDDLDWLQDENTKVDYVISDKTYPYTNTSDLSINWKKSDPINANMALPFETSRGCIFRCLFCSYPLLGKKKMDYIRDVDNMADEFKRNHDMFGTTNYTFMDDTINESVNKLERINRAIKKSGVSIRFSCYLRIDLVAAFPEMIDILLDMGLVGAFLGIETMDETARKKVGKGMTNDKLLNTITAFKTRAQRRIWFQAGLIVGLPGETIKSIYRTNRWMIEQNYQYFDNWSWNPLYISRHHKWLISEFDRNYAKYGFKFASDDINNNQWHRDNGNSSEISTYLQAEEISRDLNQQIRTVVGFGSWQISHMLSYGIPVPELEATVSKFDVKHIELFQKKALMIADYKTTMMERAKNKLTETE